MKIKKIGENKIKKSWVQYFNILRLQRKAIIFNFIILKNFPFMGLKILTIKAPH